MKKGLILGVLFFSFSVYGADQKETKPTALTVVVGPVKQHVAKKTNIACTYKAGTAALILFSAVGTIAGGTVLFNSQHTQSLPKQPFIQINNCCGRDLLIPKDKIELIAFSEGLLRQYCPHSPRMKVKRAMPDNGFDHVQFRKMYEQFDLEKAAREHKAQQELSWWERLTNACISVSCFAHGGC